MMMKKWALLLLGVVLAFGMMAGCSSGEGDPLLDEPVNGVPADPAPGGDAPGGDAPAGDAPAEGGAGTSAPAEPATP